MMTYSLSNFANGVLVQGPRGAETIKIAPVLQGNSETLLHSRSYLSSKVRTFLDFVSADARMQ